MLEFRCFGLGAAMAATSMLLLSAPSAADTPVEYRVDQKTFKKGATSATQLTFTTYSDAGCSAETSETVLSANDTTVRYELPKNLKLKGGTKLAKAAKIQTVLAAMPPGPIYLEVTGEGVTPLGEPCQVQGTGGGGAGPPGPVGPTGPPGTFSSATCTRVLGDLASHPSPASRILFLSATCPAGATAVGGGYGYTSLDLFTTCIVVQNVPSADLTSWEVQVTSPTNDCDATMRAEVVCCSS